MVLNTTQISTVLYKAGFRGSALDTAIKICYCESGFNPSAHNIHGEDSRGLMQINVNVWSQFSDLDLFNPQINANVAYQIYLLAGKKFRDWTCNNLINTGGATQAGISLGAPGTIALGAIVFLGGIYYYYSRM